jgi:predicted methyltransferase MtxX (methanogen marker protein 4)
LTTKASSGVSFHRAHVRVKQNAVFAGGKFQNFGIRKGAQACILNAEYIEARQAQKNAMKNGASKILVG